MLWCGKPEGGRGEREDLHIVTVHMHGMASKGKVVVYNQTDGLV
jgi:hypothetical protein